MWTDQPIFLIQLRAYLRLHDLWLAWNDERTSPMSTICWFGKMHKGREMRQVYQDQWIWNKQLEGPHGDDLKEILERWQRWKARHPRARPVNRAPPVIVNPKGQRLGRRDDGVASDNDEDYTSDDGFVVRSDEDEEGETESGSERNTSEDDLVDGREGEDGVDELPDVVHGSTESEDEVNPGSLTLPEGADDAWESHRSETDEPRHVADTEIRDSSSPSAENTFSTLAPRTPSRSMTRRRIWSKAQLSSHNTPAGFDTSFGSGSDSDDAPLVPTMTPRTQGLLTPMQSSGPNGSRKRKMIMLGSSASASESDTVVSTPSRRRKKVVIEWDRFDDNCGDGGESGGGAGEDLSDAVHGSSESEDEGEDSDAAINYDYITGIGLGKPCSAGDRRKLHKVANAYAELEAELTRLRQEKSSLEAQVKDLTKGKRRLPITPTKAPSTRILLTPLESSGTKETGMNTALVDLLQAPAHTGSDCGSDSDDQPLVPRRQSKAGAIATPRSSQSRISCSDRSMDVTPSKQRERANRRKS